MTNPLCTEGLASVISWPHLATLSEDTMLSGPTWWFSHAWGPNEGQHHGHGHTPVGLCQHGLKDSLGRAQLRVDFLSGLGMHAHRPWSDWSPGGTSRQSCSWYLPMLSWLATDPQPVPASACPCPQGDAWCQGWCCPGAPSALLLVGWGDGTSCQALPWCTHGQLQHPQGAAGPHGALVFRLKYLEVLEAMSESELPQ